FHACEGAAWSPLGWHRAARDARACTASHDGHTRRPSFADDDLHVGGCARKRYEVGRSPIEAVVVLVHDDVCGAPEDRVRSERALEPFDQAHSLAGWRTKRSRAAAVRSISSTVL